MKYLYCLLLAGCSIDVNVPSHYTVDDVKVKHELRLDNPILDTCFIKLQKTDIDNDILNCYFNTLKELQNEYRPKNY